MVPGPLSTSSRETARGPGGEHGRGTVSSASFNPQFLPCCPAFPHSCLRSRSCVAPLLSHFSLCSVHQLWVRHPYHSSSLLPLLARSCPISYFHCELCLTLPSESQFCPSLSAALLHQFKAHFPSPVSLQRSPLCPLSGQPQPVWPQTNLFNLHLGHLVFPLAPYPVSFVQSFPPQIPAFVSSSQHLVMVIFHPSGPSGFGRRHDTEPRTL